MAVFRVEKNKGYTVMSNHHLRNKELSLKAKGLLSQMLSLPEDWDYTLAGLSLINREKIDAIREAVRELENAGYIQRSRERDEKGCLRGTTYVIYEQPPKLDLPTLEKPTLDNPTLENPMLEKPTLENPTQLNKELLKTNLPTKEKLNTDISSTHSIPFHSLNPSPLEDAAQPPERKRKETTDAYSVYEEIIKDNIEYDYVKQGQIYGLLGRNGAGKTTIMKMILGLTDITSGEVDVFGQNIKGREKRVYPRIGAIIETPGFYPNLTGTENLEIFAKLRGTAAPNAVKNALEIVGLPYRDKKLFSKYSLGMKQRLGIANAILHDPELLILDEPTNGLDPIGIAEVRDFIKTLSIERGKTILISSHILSEIALLADDIGIIDHGVLLEENSMNELQKKNSKYILLQVSDIPKTSLVLERQFGVTEYSVQDEHTLRIYDTSLDMAAVNKALVVQDIAVISSQLCNDTLEDYFKKITGGEGIA